MRIVAVLLGIVALVIFSIFVLLAAPISERAFTTAELTGFVHRAPPTGILYYISRGATRHLWLYFLVVVAVCVLMVVGVVKNKVGDLVVWLFVGIALLLNVLAIVSIRLVGVYSMPRW